MNDTSSNLRCRCEYTYAFLLLRLFLGLRTFLAGIEKWESRGTYSFENYYNNMGRMAEGITGASFLPLWMTKSYAHSLGYILLVLGVLLLLGVKARLTLFVSGLVYVGLAFGMMAVQEGEGIAWLAIHVIMFVGALLLVRHNRYSVWADKYE